MDGWVEGRREVYIGAWRAGGSVPSQQVPLGGSIIDRCGISM